MMQKGNLLLVGCFLYCGRVLEFKVNVEASQKKKTHARGLGRIILVLKLAWGGLSGEDFPGSEIVHFHHFCCISFLNEKN